MDEIKVVLKDLPCKVRGFTLYDGLDNYTVILNSRLNRETQTTTYLHELSHIISNDFDSMIPVGEIERIRHN